MTIENSELAYELKSGFDDLKGHLESKYSRLNDQVRDLQNEITDLARKSYGNAMGMTGTTNRNSIGQQFVQFKGLQDVKGGANRSGFLEVKNTITNLLANPFSQQVADRIGEDKQPKLNLLAAMPRMAVDQQSVQFQRLDAYTNAADTQVAEGNVKAQGTVPVELITAPIETIAHFMVASEQLLADSPIMAVQIDNLLRNGVLQKAEHRVLHGSGAIGQMKGLMTSATAATPTTGLTPVDRIGEQAAALDAIGWNPTHVVLNRADFFAIISERDNEGRYVTTTPYDAEAHTVWGLSIVISPAQTAGQALVFDASQTMLLDRESVRVEAGRKDDDFVRNLLSIRGELRAGVICFSDSSLAKFALS